MNFSRTRSILAALVLSILLFTTACAQKTAGTFRSSSTRKYSAEERTSGC